MNKQLYFTVLLTLAVVLSVGVACASDASVADSYDAGLVDDALCASADTENVIGSSEISVSDVSNGDDDSFKVLSSNNAESDNSLSSNMNTNSHDNVSESESNNSTNAKLAASSDTNGNGNNLNAVANDQSNKETVKATAKVATKLTSADVNVIYGKDGYLVATLKDANGKAIKDAKVGFAYNGVKYIATDANGQAKFSTKDLAKGTYSIKMAYYGNGTYAASNQAIAKIYVVDKIATKLTSANVNVNSGREGYLVAALKDASGRAIKGAKVGFAYNGVKYILTDANGQAKFSTKDLAVGTYNIKMAYYGNGTYAASNQATAKVVVNKVNKVATKLTSADVNVYSGKDGYLVATLKDASGRAIKGAKVGFAYNGVKYVLTDANGQAKFSTSAMPVGTYNIKMAYYGDGTYAASNQATAKVVVNKVNKVATKLTSADVNVYSGKDGYLVATLKDASGRAIKGAKVGFAYNGVKYIATDANGQAKFSTKDLAGGTYSIKMAYYGDGTYEASNQVTAKIRVIKTATKLTASDVYVVYRGDGNLVATLKDANGKAIKGAKVGFAYNGVKYVLTDANGQAKFSTKDLAKGTYSIKMAYYGNGTYEASNQAIAKIYVVDKIPTKLTSSDALVIRGSDGYLVAALKDANGKAIKGAKVGFAYNGVKYVLTDANGQAKFSTKGMSLGIYSIKMAYYGNGTYAASNQVISRIIVSDPTTKLTWKSSTNFFESTNTFKVLLTDKNNIILPGKIVKLTINSKTYSAKTDSDGYATFTVSLPSGSYTASYSFAKDSLHKASSGSTKITVTVIPTLSNDPGYGYFVFGRDMYNVDLNALAAGGTTDLFLNYYAIEKHGRTAVENWISSANKLGIRVHIWMQVFYEGSWVNPVSGGSPNTAYFNTKIAEAQSYAKLKGISGVLLDYLRYPGTAYRTSGGTAAISQFTKSVTEEIHKISSSIIVSATLMPETTVSEYYYGQDYSAISSYVDVVLPMIYKGNYGTSTSWIKSTSKWYVDNSRGAKVWTVLLAYRSDSDESLLPTSELTNDIYNALGGGSNGVILFRYGLTNLINFKNL